MRAITATVATLLILAAAPAAQAALITFHVNLDGASETPSVVTPGLGSGTVVVDTVGFTMALSLNFSGLLGNTTASHIHCCNVPTVTSPVSTQLPSFAGFPLGVTSGSYANTFDMTLASSYNPTFITNNGGTTTSAFAALLAGMLDGRAYWNVHTNRFPGGEIRGALEVPEPSSLLLLGIALVGLASRHRLADRAAEGRLVCARRTHGEVERGASHRRAFRHPRAVCWGFRVRQERSVLDPARTSPIGSRTVPHDEAGSSISVTLAMLCRSVGRD